MVGVEAQHEVMHAGVAHQADLNDVIGGEADLLRRLPGDEVQPFDDGLVEPGQPVVVVHGVGDAAHDILAVGHLRVHEGGGGHHPTRGQVAEVAGHGRGAHVHRQTVARLPVPRLDADDLPVHPDGGRDPPAALPDPILELQKGSDINAQALQPEAAGQLGSQAFPVGLGILQGGRRQLGVAFADGGTEGDGPLRGRFPHDLFLAAALLWHEDQDVAQHPGRAGEAVVPHSPMLG